MTIAFLIVQKYCQRVKKLRIISRTHEEIFQQLWKVLYGSVRILALEGLVYTQTCKDIILAIEETYDDLYGKILISEKCSEIFGYGIGRMMSVNNFKKFVRKHILNNDVKEITKRYPNFSGKSLKEVIDKLIEIMDNESTLTIQKCVKLLDERKELKVDIASDIIGKNSKIQSEIHNLYNTGLLRTTSYMNYLN